MQWNGRGACTHGSGRVHCKPQAGSHAQLYFLQPHTRHIFKIRTNVSFYFQSRYQVESELQARAGLATRKTFGRRKKPPPTDLMGFFDKVLVVGNCCMICLPMLFLATKRPPWFSLLLRRTIRNGGTWTGYSFRKWFVWTSRWGFSEVEIKTIFCGSSCVKLVYNNAS